MKLLKFFEEFIKEGIVKKISRNPERAKSLILESERKMLSLNEHLEKIGVKNENANDYIEYCYDLLMRLVRAKMLVDGYSASGFGAHEAEVSYLRNLGFKEQEVQFADQMRFFRNGMLYYGTILDKEYAEKVIEFTKKNYLRLREILK